MIAWFTQSASEILGLLCAAGVITGALRWKHATRRDILLAFILILAATAMREAVVYIWGVRQWPDPAVLMSGVARLLQIVGAVMFINASVKGVCPQWVVWALLLLIFVVSALV